MLFSARIIIIAESGRLPHYENHIGKKTPQTNRKMPQTHDHIGGERDMTDGRLRSFTKFFGDWCGAGT
ncbi:MAG: hypothetical protein LBS62_09185 [Clostridiales bacterium]|jgi:hypothetical protein|nr:hypothetical protein [Clostridiales bacterium]